MTSSKKHINPKRIRALALILLPALFFASCERKTEPPGKTVASVDNARLDEKQLRKIMELRGLPQNGRNEAVKNWIEEEIYFKEAEARGLINSAKYEILSTEMKRQIAKALLFDEFASSNKVTATENEVRTYYEKRKNEFILREKGYVLDRVFFDDLTQALEFRHAAIKNGWDFAKRRVNGKTEKNVLVLQSEISPLKAMRAVEFLEINEISPVFRNYEKKFFVFRIKKKLFPHDIFPLEMVYEKAETRVLMEKRAEAFNRYKKEIFGKHKIEIYGDLNE